MNLMADPDSQARLHGASAGNAANGKVAANGAVTGVPTNGKVPKRDSEDIVAEIERTRQNLARTIDSLADRVSPAGNARRLRDRATEELSKPEVQLAVAAVVLATAGIVIYRIWGRRRT
jgi:hypothetical protein